MLEQSYRKTIRDNQLTINYGFARLSMPFIPLKATVGDQIIRLKDKAVAPISLTGGRLEDTLERLEGRMLYGKYVCLGCPVAEANHNCTKLRLIYMNGKASLEANVDDACISDGRLKVNNQHGDGYVYSDCSVTTT